MGALSAQVEQISWTETLSRIPEEHDRLAFLLSTELVGLSGCGTRLNVVVAGAVRTRGGSLLKAKMSVRLQVRHLLRSAYFPRASSPYMFVSRLFRDADSASFNPNQEKRK